MDACEAMLKPRLGLVELVIGGVIATPVIRCQKQSIAAPTATFTGQGAYLLPSDANI